MLLRTCPVCLIEFDADIRADGSARTNGPPRTFCRRRCKSRKANTPEAQWRYRLSRFGMTPDDYEALLEAQGGGCAICSTKSADSVGRRLHVDHDHVTGVVRGLLCSHCNQAIGKFNDNPVLLQAAIAYLSRAGTTFCRLDLGSDPREEVGQPLL